jgi:hypothetical protein
VSKRKIRAGGVVHNKAGLTTKQPRYKAELMATKKHKSKKRFYHGWTQIDTDGGNLTGEKCLPVNRDKGEGFAMQGWRLGL